MIASGNNKPSNELISFNKSIKAKLKEIEPKDLQVKVKYSLWCDQEHSKESKNLNFENKFYFKFRSSKMKLCKEKFTRKK
jgi:hypothetical protein